MDWARDKLFRSASLSWLERVRRECPDGEVSSRQAYMQVPGLGLIRLLSPQQGIWKPAGMQACLSVRTTAGNIYDDRFSERAAAFHYKYRERGGYDHADNRAMRLAMEHRLPFLYFTGVDSGLYEVHLVLAVQEAPGRTGVMLQMLPEQIQPHLHAMTGTVAEPAGLEMAYRTSAARHRVHQPEFRRRVMKAYRRRCAVCSFKQEKLLDAAHIIPDAEGGRPQTSNGLSLCRIHHGAYDQQILGIDPDYRVRLNRDTLEEKDGPMLKHGFHGLEGARIVLPSSRANYPDRDKLAERYQRFLRP